MAETGVTHTKGTWGGAGRGQGRPVSTKTKITQKLNEMLAKRLEKRFGPMIEAQIDAAIGIVSEKYDSKKGDYYYEDKGPNVEAFKALTNRVLGMPQAKVEHSGGVGVLHIIQQLDSDGQGDSDN